MEFTSLTLFAVTFASILLLPGPNSAFVVGQSLRYGAIGSLSASIGFASATGLHAILVFSGIGLIVQKYMIALVLLKWLGVCYLLYLAYRAFTAKVSVIDVHPQDISSLRMYLTAMFVSLTNPKALLASLMLYPLFINQSQPFLLQALLLTFTAMVISFGVYSAYGFAASSLKGRLSGSMFANNLIGGLYLGAAGALASKQT